MSNRRTRVTRHLHALVGERHPEGDPKALADCARYLAQQFADCGWTTTRQPFRALGKTYRNILAIKNPSGHRKDHAAPILIGAHYDTVINSPGADDNASALAVLLEVAYHLKRTTLKGPVWLAAFCLEEQGLLGSQAFASRLKRTHQQLAGTIILECVGYACHDEGSQRIPTGVPLAVPSVGNFLAIIGNEESRPLVTAIERSAARSVPTLKTLGLAVPGRGMTLPNVRRSDHAAFWDEGFQAVMLTDTANFRNPHYHQPTDTIDTLNLTFLEGVVDTVVASVKEIAGCQRP
ncbi:MAG TPA: M28 family peptidase [Nitrospira sp.]